MRKYLFELRKNKNKTQQEVALRIGITRAYYQQIEAGTRQKRMDIVLLTKMADYFGISLEEIIRLEERFRSPKEGSTEE